MLPICAYFGLILGKKRSQDTKNNWRVGSAGRFDLAQWLLLQNVGVRSVCCFASILSPSSDFFPAGSFDL